MKKKFLSVQSFIKWLIDNEGFQLSDYYGRKWKYERYEFYFKDIGKNNVFEKRISCLHLYGTVEVPETTSIIINS